MVFRDKAGLMEQEYPFLTWTFFDFMG